MTLFDLGQCTKCQFINLDQSIGGQLINIQNGGPGKLIDPYGIQGKGEFPSTIEKCQIPVFLQFTPTIKIIIRNTK